MSAPPCGWDIRAMDAQCAKDGRAIFRTFVGPSVQVGPLTVEVHDDRLSGARRLWPSDPRVEYVITSLTGMGRGRREQRDEADSERDECSQWDR